MTCEITPTVVVIVLKGHIGSKITFKKTKHLIDKAFSRPNLKAVCVLIDSGGGSPVQAEQIAAYFQLRSREKEVPLFAFAEDSMASGGYLIACAASQIFVSPCSVVGSIGAVSVSFCLEELLARVGVRPRVLTAGARKAGLNPFEAPTAAQLEDQMQLLNDCHAQFSGWVREQRAGRLTPAAEEEAFSGAAFIGRRAVELGLADGTYSVLEETVSERVGEEGLQFVRVRAARRRGGLERLAGWLGLGATIAGGGELPEGGGRLLGRLAGLPLL